MSVSAIGSGGGGYSYAVQSRPTSPPDPSEMAGRMIQEMDADGDGALSAGEISVDQDQLSKADSDGDGKLSEAELISLMNTIGPPPRMDGGQGMAQGDQGMGGAGQAPPDADEMFSQLDTDGDGVISQAEFLAGRPEDVSEDQAAQMWSRLDSSGAGSLSQEEFVSAMESMGPPPGPPPGGGAGNSASAGTTTGSASETTVPSLNELLASLLANYGLSQYQQSINSGLSGGYYSGSILGGGVNLTA